MTGHAAAVVRLETAVTNEVNALHATGYDLNGAAGGNFFTPLASAAGSAQAISLSAGIMADPSTIAAASTTYAGDNGVARVLSLGREGIRIGVKAPISVAVHRREVYGQICEENRAAAGALAHVTSDLSSDAGAVAIVRGQS